MAYLTSDDWIPIIQDLSAGFQRKIGLVLGGQYISINENHMGTGGYYGLIHEDYYRIAKILKKKSKYMIEIYDKNTGKISIDYHLFAAVYIRALLAFPPFSLDIPCDKKYLKTHKYLDFPNEYFVIAFLEAIFQIRNDDFEKKLRLDENFKIDFINTLAQYKTDIRLLNLITFANEIGIIEHNYFN